MRDSVRKECAEALAGGTCESNADGVLRQAIGAVTPRHFAAENRSDGAIRVSDRKLHFDRLPVFERVLRQFDQQIVERLIQSMILVLHAPRRDRDPEPQAYEESASDPAFAPSSDRRLCACRACRDAPTISSIVRKPSFAISSRTSSAIIRK